MWCGAARSLKVKHSTTTFFDSLKRKRVNPLQTTLWCGTARSLKVMLKPHSLITHILFQKKSERNTQGIRVISLVMPPLTGAAHSVLYKYSQIIPNTSSVTQEERNSEAVEATTLHSVSSYVSHVRLPPCPLFALHRCRDLAPTHRRWRWLRV
jgi:hypothetical protein